MKTILLSIILATSSITMAHAQDVSRGSPAPVPVIETADGSVKGTVRLLTPLIALAVMAVIVASSDIPES